MIEVANRLQDVQEYYFSRKLREIDEMNRTGTKVINLGIGSPDLPPHPDVIDVLHTESAKPSTHAYQSYKGAPVMRNAMANWYKTWYDVTLDPNTQILPLIGSKEGITHICMTYLNEGDAALVPDPGYPAYASAVKVAGAKALTFALKEENNYFPDFNELTQLVENNSNVKLLFVNYPNMPTGQLPTREMFNKLVEWATEHKVLIVHDNPYSFILNEHPISLMASPGAMDVALELNSLSKSHNLAGWRVGMLIGTEKRLLEVLRFKSNLDSGMFLPLQLAAAKALELPASWYEEVNAVYRKRRELAFELLSILGCTFNRSQAGMFVWASVPATSNDGFELADEVLNKARVFITPGGIFGNQGKGYLRISLCSPVEVLAEAMERIKDSKI